MIVTFFNVLKMYYYCCSSPVIHPLSDRLASAVLALDICTLMLVYLSPHLCFSIIVAEIFAVHHQKFVFSECTPEGWRKYHLYIFEHKNLWKKNFLLCMWDYGNKTNYGVSTKKFGSPGSTIILRFFCLLHNYSFVREGLKS